MYNNTICVFLQCAYTFFEQQYIKIVIIKQVSCCHSILAKFLAPSELALWVLWLQERIQHPFCSVA